MEPAYAVALPDRKKFWKDQLFDFGFPPRVIEIAVSYEFRWGDIISDLFSGKFGPQNQHFADALPPYFCEQTLKRLLALALHEGTDSVLIDQLAESLKLEGVEVTWTEKPTAQTTEAQTSRHNVASDAQREVLKQAHKPRPKLPPPVRPVNTSGGPLRNSASEPSEVPHDPPIYFPTDLWPQTNVVLLEARRMFPERTQTLELCKHVVAEMTPIFVEAVKARKIKAGAVQRENGGGMEDLLHSLLVHNDDGIKGGFSSLSDQAYQLGKRVRESNEWVGLAKAIAETKRESTGTQTGQAAPKSVSANTIDDAFSRGPGHRHSPVAFISYSWDSEPHKKWVLDLAYRLRGKDGAQIILDHWHLQPGHDKTVFMEESVTNSDFVILICTPDYARKASSREGGVGYEATIITGELAANIRQGKFIPILQDGDWESSLPVWIKTKVGVDLRGNPYSDEEYQRLLRVLHNEALEPPPVGPKPIFRNTAPVDQDVVPPEWAVRAMLLDDDLSPYEREVVRRKLSIIRIHALHPRLTIWLTNRSERAVKVKSISLWHANGGRNHKRLTHGVPSDNRKFVDLGPRTENVPIAFVTDDDAMLKLQGLGIVDKHLPNFSFRQDIDVEVRVEYDLLGMDDEYRETVRVGVHGNRQIESL